MTIRKYGIVVKINEKLEVVFPVENEIKNIEDVRKIMSEHNLPTEHAENADILTAEYVNPLAHYGVTSDDKTGALAIFDCKECGQTWEEAVDQLTWLNSVKQGTE